MGFNFIAADRDQPFLLPPDIRQRQPADHLAWFIVVDQLDLVAFHCAYGGDGHGRAAYDPRMLPCNSLLYVSAGPNDRGARRP